jgi:galactokinase
MVAADPQEEYTLESQQDIPENINGWAGYLLGILQELAKKGKFVHPFNLMFSGNIPTGAGLSSSAALENAFVFALNELFQLGLSRIDMVHISHAAEQGYVGVHCGIMDQYASMMGQSGKILFLDCQTLRSDFLPMDPGEYEWVLINTHVRHNLADSAYNDRRRTCETVAERCGVPSLREVTPTMLEEVRPDISKGDYRKALFVLEENARVLQAVSAIRNNDVSSLGRLLFESHKGLKEQYEVSCEELDFLVDLARESEGVLGARMMGGGFGGCTLNLIVRGSQDSFLRTVRDAYSDRYGIHVSSYIVVLSDGCRLMPFLSK